MKILKYKFFICTGLIICLCVTIISYVSIKDNQTIKVNIQGTDDPKSTINWVDFNIPAQAMEKALAIDIASHASQDVVSIDWIELLAYLGCKYWGNFKNYKEKDLVALQVRLNNGETMEEISRDLKLYNYYIEAYGAVLGGLAGEFQLGKTEGEEIIWQKKYGLKGFSPIAENFSFSHFDDFGVSRSYGFKRTHLGHDMMTNTGTPVTAVESGIIEELGWNQYGGWRIGVRSFDKKRYYYYAHLQKDRPFHADIQKGGTVTAGSVIGYVGRTGYSVKENVNNIKQSHLHWGLQLIFDESKKDSPSQIWINVYEITKLLQSHKSSVKKSAETKDFNRVYQYKDGWEQ